MIKRNAFTGNPYAGNPHVRFDEGEVASAATPRRGSLLYNTRKMMALAAVAASAAMYSPSFGATAVWKNNADGNMNDTANWVDGYIPQEGDTLDFSVLASTIRYIYENFGDGRSFETVKGLKYLYMGESQNDGHVGWKFQYVTYDDGAEFRVGSSGRFEVTGKLTFTGSSKNMFAELGTTTVVVGELVDAGNDNSVRRFANANGNIRAGKFTHEGSGYCQLTCSGSNGANNALTRYIVGAGGFGFGDSTGSARYWYCSSAG